MNSSAPRSRRDRCPGAWRPWVADDGLLVRLRLIGGLLSTDQLRALSAFADEYADGRIHLTSRANLQVRGLPAADGGGLPSEVARALTGTGLLPSRTHELVRNVLVSPTSGFVDAVADLRGVAAELDRLLCADPALADLPGRFLFGLDAGVGDLIERYVDLGLVALGHERVQLRAGRHWGPVVPTGSAAAELVRLAGRFLAVRGDGDTACWHVDELDHSLFDHSQFDDSLFDHSQFDRPAPAPAVQPSGPLPFGPGPAGVHRQVPEHGLDPSAVTALIDDVVRGDTLVVTPWRGVLIPEAGNR